ncbi:MAG: hypothetical protein UMR38_01480 [Candidatus Izemoplasma sp.]|nr:hypothetical protein [Candidatus Izemoplasma sp.]
MRYFKAIVFLMSITILFGCEEEGITDDVIIDTATVQFNDIIDEISTTETVTCDRYFVRNADDCNAVFTNYLLLYNDDFEGEPVVSINNESIYVEQRGVKNQVFQFVFEYEMIGDEIYFTNVLFQTMNDNPNITKEDVAVFYATMALDDRDDPEVLCQEYFAAETQVECTENRDYLRLFDDKFDSVSLFRIDAFTYIYNIALARDYRIVYQYYITMESLGDDMRIDEIITYNKSVINEFNELKIYINEFMRGVTTSNVRNLCFQENKIDTECIEIMNLIDSQSVIFDYERIDNELVFKLILAGEKKLTMYFDVRNILSEDYSLTLYFDMFDYTIESNFLSPKDLENMLNTIYALDYGRLSQASICDKYISTSSPDLVKTCKNEQDFFQSVDSKYEIKQVTYIAENEYLVEAFNLDNTEKEAYEIRVDYNQTAKRWFLASYEKEEYHMMSSDIPEVLLEAAFYEFTKINPYDYCAYQAKEAAFITDDCIIDFYNTRERGFTYELISVENAPKDNTFNVKYYKENGRVTSIVESIVTVYINDMAYFYKEDVQITYEVDPEHGNEIDRFERQLNLYQSLYLDESVTSDVLYDDTIDPHYDKDAYIARREANLGKYQSLTVEDISMIVTKRYETLYEITYRLRDVDDNITTTTITVPSMGDSFKIPPLFTDIPYHITEAQMTVFIDDYMDALAYDEIGNFTCDDFYSEVEHRDCENLRSYVGDLILDFEVSAHQDNIFRVHLTRQNETEIYSESYLYTVKLINGTIKIVDIVPYQVIA